MITIINVKNDNCVIAIIMRAYPEIYTLVKFVGFTVCMIVRVRTLYLYTLSMCMYIHTYHNNIECIDDNLFLV